MTSRFNTIGQVINNSSLQGAQYRALRNSTGNTIAASEVEPSQTTWCLQLDKKDSIQLIAWPVIP